MFRPVLIRRYVNAMQTRGFSTEDVLAGSHIDFDALRDRLYVVELEQCKTVVANMIRLTGNQGLGFEIGSDVELVDFGIVGHAILTSKTVRDAFLLWVRYCNSLVGALFKQTLEEPQPGIVSTTIIELVPMGFVFNFCVEELLLMTQKLGSALADRKLEFRQIELSYPAPEHQALYRHCFGCTPRFNAKKTRITFALPNLDQPLRGTDEDFNRICVQHCSQILKQIEGQSSLAFRLRALLLTKPNIIPDLDQAAHQLNMSPRTLTRRLQQEGITYLQLVNEFRFDLARKYLDSTDITTKEIGYLLGFKNTDSFRRAFKSFTGQTILEYQVAHKLRKTRSNSPNK